MNNLNESEKSDLHAWAASITSNQLASSDLLLEVLNEARKRLSEELDFFWKRATYFATIIGFLIAGAMTVLSKIDASSFAVIELHKSFGAYCALILCFLGFFISVFWYYANLGSKYWYERWENLVDALEQKRYGVCVYQARFGGPSVSTAPYFLRPTRKSVTSIAICLSLLMSVIFYLVICVVVNAWMCKNIMPNLCYYALLLLIEVIVFIGVFRLISNLSRGNSAS